MVLPESESREPAFVLVTKTGTTDFIKNITVTTSEIQSQPVQQTKENSGHKRKTATKSGNNKNKTKQSQSNNKQTPKQKVRATLFGLSTLKRDGDVIVNMVTDHTIVKTNFILGPLTLRVDREVSTNFGLKPHYNKDSKNRLFMNICFCKNYEHIFCIYNFYKKSRTLMIIISKFFRREIWRSR